MGEGGREGTLRTHEKHTPNARRHKQATHVGMRAHKATGNPLTARPQSKPTNTQEQQTWLATPVMQQERCQKRWER